ncbi:MAG: cytidine deaminase [Bacteroidales bacterium]|nr:cytidine deaminase [Bacteroidales bacterium]
MQQENLNIKYTVLNLNELSAEDKKLVEHAAATTQKAYSPYSRFRVGAAVLMDNGSIVSGANQENIAYPSGLCAERTALFACAMQEGKAVAIAISAKDENSKPATAYPCGACRQVMNEFQNNISKQPIRVLIHRKDDTVLCFDNVDGLLPFSFDF